MKRRTFITSSSILTLGTLAAAESTFSILNTTKSTLNVGVIGVGARGLGTLGLLLDRKDTNVVAICDIDPITLARAKNLFDKKSKKQPAIFDRDEYAYKDLIAMKGLDAVLICTPWEWHTPMSVDAMEAKVAVGCEVAGAMSVEECWQLVRAYEKTKTPFMIMENVCYRRDVMAILNMVRQDYFGELIHLEGGYEHDLREVKFNDGSNYYGGGVNFGKDGYSEAHWRTDHSVHRNGDLYPTHGIGPISNYININRGNRFEYLTSMSSKARGLNNYIKNHPKGGENHPNAKVKFRLGDVVTTNIMTSQGESILLTHDTNLPRPYSLGFRVQGEKGIWMDLNSSIYLEGISPPHKWEAAKAYLDKHDHPMWKLHEKDAAGAGHGGMDYLIIDDFITALKDSKPMPLDVYDHASWSVITCLSEQSIAQGGEPQAFPDFTNGKWINRKPLFAL